MKKLLVFLSESPERDLATTTFSIVGPTATVFSCREIIAAGCRPEDYPIVATIVMGARRGEANEHVDVAYRVLGMSSDPERGVMEMRLEQIGAPSMREIRRMIKLDRVLGRL